MTNEHKNEDFETKNIYDNPYEQGTEEYKKWRADFIAHIMKTTEKPEKHSSVEQFRRADGHVWF